MAVDDNQVVIVQFEPDQRHPVEEKLSKGTATFRLHGFVALRRQGRLRTYFRFYNALAIAGSGELTVVPYRGPENCPDLSRDRAEVVVAVYIIEAKYGDLTRSPSSLPDVDPDAPIHVYKVHAGRVVGPVKRSRRWIFGRGHGKVIVPFEYDPWERPFPKYPCAEVRESALVVSCPIATARTQPVGILVWVERQTTSVVDRAISDFEPVFWRDLGAIEKGNVESQDIKTVIGTVPTRKDEQWRFVAVIHHEVIGFIPDEDLKQQANSVWLIKAAKFDGVGDPCRVSLAFAKRFPDGQFRRFGVPRFWLLKPADPGEMWRQLKTQIEGLKAEYDRASSFAYDAFFGLERGNWAPLLPEPVRTEHRRELLDMLRYRSISILFRERIVG
jgi:hypothetical protein